MSDAQRVNEEFETLVGGEGVGATGEVSYGLERIILLRRV